MSASLSGQTAIDATRGVARRDAASAGGVSRAARLWEAIRCTRDELDVRRRRAEEIGERFVATIRPREQGLTRTVCRVTERLVEHHERSSLDGAERTLLGLWINENLQSLSAHPFAPRVETDALSLRWRGHLHACSHPLDVPLASLYARRAGAASPFPADAPAPRRSGGEAGGGDDADARAAGTPDDASATPDTPERDVQRLIARLFRRLARVLHPDRERDEGRKRDKHRLMSECLRAREAHDIDTLLSLYTAHVGALPDELVDGSASLERLLREQLDALRRSLRELCFGDALQTMIVERYGADDPLERERRFTEHARAIDDETVRFEGLERLIANAAGLREALAERRELELDRLSIDELTGQSRD